MDFQGIVNHGPPVRFGCAWRAPVRHNFLPAAVAYTDPLEFLSGSVVAKPVRCMGYVKRCDGVKTVKPAGFLGTPLASLP
jgi:hypothetical protein